ncbi:hypothetical protein PENANT_c073G03389, partial [Penicillium antarcticum]
MTELGVEASILRREQVDRSLIVAFNANNPPFGIEVQDSSRIEQASHSLLRHPVGLS